MKTELDTLATAIYVKTDDLLKASPHLAPWRPAVGIAPQLTDAELVTLAMMQAMPGFTSEARWLRHARSRLQHLFPYLPKQPGYNKRLRKAAGLLRRVTRLLAADTSVWSDDVRVVDSTPVECGRSRETVKRSDLAGWAEYGYCASPATICRWDQALASDGRGALVPARRGPKGTSKVTADVVARIRELEAAGQMLRQIAAVTGCRRSVSAARSPGWPREPASHRRWPGRGVRPWADCGVARAPG